MPILEADELFACLERHGVLYVLIGGLAAVLHGSPLPTIDADICPSRKLENLEQLAAALVDLDARIRVPETSTGMPFPREASFLANVELLNLTTRVGDLDLTFLPAGTGGFEDLFPRAVVMSLRGSQVHVAKLDDIIRSKEAANRPKDHRTLPVLRQLRDELRASENDSK